MTFICCVHWVIPSTQNCASLMANRLFKNSNRSMNYDLTKTDWPYQDHIFSIVICSMEFARAQWMFMKSGKLEGPQVTLLRSKRDQGLSSVQFSRSVVSDSLRPHESQHTRPPCPSSSPRVHSNSRPSSPWCHPAISSSVVPFSSCPQSLSASESFRVSQLFAWGG